MKPSNQNAAVSSVHNEIADLKRTHEAAMMRLEKLKTENQRLKISEKRLSESEKNYAFIAQTANELLKIDSLRDVYAFIAKKLHQLLNLQGIVAVVEFYPDKGYWKMQHIEGISSWVPDLTRLFGFDLRDAEGKINSSYYDKIASCHLVEVGLNLPGLMDNRISAFAGQSIKKLLSLREMYCIAFQQDNQIMGNITFTTNKKTGPVNKELIESFVGQVSIFIKRMKTEEALRESEEKYRRIAENMTDVVWITDLKMNPVYVSPSIYRLAGFHSGDYLAMNEYQKFPRAFVHTFRNAITKEVLREVNPSVDRNRTIVLEGEHFHAEGHIINISMHISFLRDEKGNPAGLQGLTRDITEKLKAERELIAAKEKAEESDRLKTAFLQNLSHEIRTPLNSIAGFAGLISNPELSPETRKEYSQIIIDRGKHLTDIIGDILTMASLETGQAQLYAENVNIDSLLDQVKKEFAEAAEAKGLTLRIENNLHKSDCVGITDKTKVTQILNNLVSNALKFTRKGGIVVGCRRNNYLAEFFVRDTGIGIDPGKQGLIFERFAQADENIRRDYGGTGLGLSICKGFVTLLGGDIRVESLPGKGSAFFFTIPWKPVQSEASAPSSANEPIIMDKPVTFLIAEDDRFNFLLLKTMLRSVNCRILHAENGQLAVEFCKKEKVDLVLMDIKMPIMDGYTATKMIREINPDLPVVAQTAHALQAEREQFGWMFEEYLIKPISEDELMSVVNRIIQNVKTGN